MVPHPANISIPGKSKSQKKMSLAGGSLTSDRSDWSENSPERGRSEDESIDTATEHQCATRNQQGSRLVSTEPRMHADSQQDHPVNEQIETSL